MIHKQAFFHFFAIFVISIGSPAMAGAQLVPARKIVPGLIEDIKYSTTDNFTGKDLYGDFAACWLLKDAAAMLAKAQENLRKADPDMRLVVYDCARPVEVQKVMWDVVKDTDKRIYVADPAKGSVHNYGCAVDLGLVRVKGQGRAGKELVTLDMGTGFDHFGPEAHTTDEAQMLMDGKLSREAWLNRLRLREAMVSAGFYQLPHEWWHFDCMKLDELKSGHKPVEALSGLR